MRLNNYLNNQYIGLTKDKTWQCKDKKVSSLLKELNMILDRYSSSNEYKFGLIDSSEYKSPSEVLDNELDDKKLEKLTQRWMKLSEKFEEIKELHLDNLKEI